MYHRLGEPDHAGDVYCIRPQIFSAQMRLLARTGHVAVTIDDFFAWLCGNFSLPANAFLITFDDGFNGVHEYAAQVLESLGWRAAVFVVAGRIGQRSDWQVTTDYPVKPHTLMDRKQLTYLAGRGFSLQSHSMMHHDLTRLDEQAVEDDLRRSRELIGEIVGAAPNFLAYPYGRYNNSIRNAAERTGYKMAFTVESGFNRASQDPFRVRRLDVFGTDSPTKLLRKLRFGTNEGGLGTMARYYARRLLGQA